MKKLFYPSICYAIFLATFLYLIGFTGNIQGYFAALAPWFPRSLDAGTSSLSMGAAILTDLGLITIFGIQHSIMARPAFKEKWTQCPGPSSGQESISPLRPDVRIADRDDGNCPGRRHGIATDCWAEYLGIVYLLYT